MKKQAVICIFICALFALAGCSRAVPSISSIGFTSSPTLFRPSSTATRPAPSPTPVPSVTPTPPPSPTPTPTISPTPTQTSTPADTPVPWGNVAINAESVSSIIQKGIWGLGSPQDSSFSTSANVLIQRTPFGIYLYKVDDLQFINFFPEAGQYLLSPAGDLLFTRLPDGSIQVIDLPSGTVRYVLAPIATLSPWMKDYVYAQLPAERPALEAEFYNQVSSISALAINPANNLVALGFGDASIGLWNLDSGTLNKQLKNVVVSDVTGLVFSPNSEKLLSSGGSADIAIWQVEDGKLLWRLPHIGHFVGQPFSPDSSLLVLEISQGTSSWASLRDAQYGDELAPRIVANVSSQAISPDNSLLVTSWYGTVKLWSIPHLTFQTKIETGLSWANASFSTDGKYILVNGGEQAYLTSDLSRDEAYPIPSQQPTLEVDPSALLKAGHLSGTIGVRYPQPEQAFAWGTLSDHEAWIMDVAKNSLTIYDFASPFMADPDLSFSADRLAACTDSGLVVISLADGNSINLGVCRRSAIIRFSADGNSIFRAAGNVIDVLDSTSGELQYNFRGQTFLVEGLAVTSDGKYLLSISNFQRTQGREVFWWQLDTPRKVMNWVESVYPNDYLYGADFDPTRKVMIIALGGLRPRRLGDGLPDHLDTIRITSLAFLPGKSIVATGDLDGVIHIWSVENWQELATLQGHRQRVSGLAFSPDGSSLLSISSDGTILLWGLP